MSSRFDNVGSEPPVSLSQGSWGAPVSSEGSGLVIPEGTLIADKYSVTGVIGEGAMGLVLAATHIELDEVVAVKLIRSEMQSLPGVVARFAREAKASVRIKSEHVPKVLDVGVSPLLGPYIVMEYLEGCDLGQVLAEDGPLPVRRAVEYLLQASEALASAHVNGIIHRDIKPENLFLIRRGELDVIKLLDFGISKAALTGSLFGGEMSLVKTSYLMGTPLYMSPEQIRATSDADHRSDIWSIGAVLYELVTGRVAFTASSITQVCAMVLEEEPEPINKYCPEAPPELQNVIMRCMKKDPNQRYQNIGELAMALLPFAPPRARVHAERIVAFLRVTGVEISGAFRPSSIPPPNSVLAATAPQTSRRARALSRGGTSPSALSLMGRTGQGGVRVGPAFGTSPQTRKSQVTSHHQQVPASSASPAALSLRYPQSVEFPDSDDGPSTTQLSSVVGLRRRTLSLALPAFGLALVVGAAAFSRNLWQSHDSSQARASSSETLAAPVSRLAQVAPSAAVSTTPSAGESQSAPRRVIIRSEPSGARVEFEGRTLGTTPLETKLLPGDRLLHIAKSGYETASLSIQIDPATSPDATIERELSLSATVEAPEPAGRSLVSAATAARWRRQANQAPAQSSAPAAASVDPPTPAVVVEPPSAPTPSASLKAKSRIPIVTENSNVRLVQ